MISRRDLIVGGACVAAAATAETLRPDEHVALLQSGRKLDDFIPKAFGAWRMHESEGVIAPESENSLAARLYNQTVSRVYLGPGDTPLMLLIAYGNTQSDTLQLHRPEVCYPAFGFDVRDSRPASFPLGGGADIPGRELVAMSPGREERISYWTRIGEYLPVDNDEQRQMRFRIALSGIIPDGVLVRMSNLLPEDGPAFAFNKRFVADFVRALPVQARPALITTDRARRIGGAAAAV
jgi:EpsI family protein